MTDKNNKVSEIKLIYKNKIKAADRVQINNAQDAFGVFWDAWDKEVIEHIEEMKMLLLDRSSNVLGIVTLSKGGTVGTILDIRLILQYALKANAHAIIIAHNHPSGNLTPSETDKKATKRIKIACSTLDFVLFDHLIISPNGTFASISDIE